MIIINQHIFYQYIFLFFQIRSTNVQDNEEGGITQQIGATMVPRDAIQEQCKMVKNVCFSFFLLIILL